MDSKQTVNNLKFDYYQYDFDEVKVGETKIATFTYHGDLNIKDVNPSCFCLSIRRTKYLDRTEIRISWKIKPTPKINYKSKKTIDITFENDDQVTLTLTATITQ